MSHAQADSTDVLRWCGNAERTIGARFVREYTDHHAKWMHRGALARWFHGEAEELAGVRRTHDRGMATTQRLVKMASLGPVVLLDQWDVNFLAKYRNAAEECT